MSKETGPRPAPIAGPGKPRFVVVERVYHQLHGEQPTGPMDHRYSRWLESDEQPYERNLKATETWQKLDFGWLSEIPVSVLYIRNDERISNNDSPTEADRALMETRVLEVSYMLPDGTVTPPMLVYPNESMRITPSTLNGLHVRCKSGVTKFRITLLPR